MSPSSVHDVYSGFHPVQPDILDHGDEVLFRSGRILAFFTSLQLVPSGILLGFDARFEHNTVELGALNNQTGSEVVLASPGVGQPQRA